MVNKYKIGCLISRMIFGWRVGWRVGKIGRNVTKDALPIKY